MSTATLLSVNYVQTNSIKHENHTFVLTLSAVDARDNEKKKTMIYSSQRKENKINVISSSYLYFSKLILSPTENWNLFTSIIFRKLQFHTVVLVSEKIRNQYITHSECLHERCYWTGRKNELIDPIKQLFTKDKKQHTKRFTIFSPVLTFKMRYPTSSFFVNIWLPYCTSANYEKNWVQKSF